ncbi:hypothetical protein H4R26_004336 [Coemansia thaxteri]|uniref:HMG box domain-containing protein n=1 Tax=Coemansia thaxteri TaxID=2663907 RepID=A0A9W8B9M5_9FUNG|nr:hypothetical protein H4R26_004336 [Coemansia thaxteri]
MQRACHISSEDSKQLAASFTIIANVLDRLATRMEQLEQATVNLPPILPIAKPTPPKPVYWLFYSDVKHFIVKDDPNISYREANRRVKQLWKDSADELREKYKQKFKDLTAVYQEELAKYNETVYSESADMATSQETVVVDTADRAIALLLSTISAPDKLSVEPCDAAEPLEPIDSAPSPMLKGKNAEKVDDSEVDAEPSVDLQREKKEKKRAAEETQGGVKTRKKKRVVEETQDGETKKRRSKYKAKESSTLSSIV